jgi:ubiquinone biosynthesis protein
MPSDLSPGIKVYLEQLLDMEALLPDCYAVYRPAVRDCLIYFLTSLPEDKKIRLFSAQMAMPEGTGTFERFVALLSHCPTLHKLGQIMARNRDLDLQLRKRLQSLETLPPSTPVETLLPLIRKETGGRTDIILEEKPLAEASVAVVLPFSLKGEEGVLKVIKPGIREHLPLELEIWSRIGAYLEERCGYYGIPPIEYGETLESLQSILEKEVHLDSEQAHLREMKAFYATSPDIIIPALYEWSTPSMTAMERIRGSSVAALSEPSKSRDTATLVIEELLARPFWSSEDPALFHGDPHGGNMLLTGEGKVALFDWSLLIPMGKELRSQIMEILLSAFMLNRYRVCRGLESLSRRPPRRRLLKEVVEKSLAEVRRGRFPGFDWMVELLDESMLRAGLSPGNSLVLFRKALLTLLNLVRDISREASPDIIMTSSGLSHLFSEVPGRMLNPASRETYRSHMRNVDIMEALSTWPLRTGRLWLGNWKEGLKAMTGKESNNGSN